MDYDLVTGLTFFVFMVILIVAILPRAGLEQRGWGATPESLRASQRERALRRRRNRPPMARDA
jgi:hypothetical protein